MTPGEKLQRQLNLLDYALMGLRRRWLKNCGLVVVFAAVIFLFASLQRLTSVLSEAARELLEEAPDITVQRMSAGRQTTLALTTADEVAKIFGVSRVVPRVWGYHFDEANGANYTVIGIDPVERPPALAQGRYPGPEGGEVVVSQEVMASLGLGERRAFSLFRPDLSQASFSVVGVFPAASGLATADTILMTMADAQDLFAWPAGQVTDLLVTVPNPRETDTVAARIAEKIPGSRVVTRSQLLKTASVIYSWRSGFGSICLLAGLAAFVILAYDRASGLSREDLREMGILKVLGWQVGEVMAIRFWESVLVSLTAYFSGSVLAWVHVVWGQGVLFQPLMFGWSVLRPELRLVPPLVAEDMLLLFSVTVLPYLAATVVPAWRSGMVRPDTVI